MNDILDLSRETDQERSIDMKISKESKGIKEWDKCMVLMDDYGYSEDEKRMLSDVLEEQEDSGKVMMAFILKMDRAQKVGKADESGVKSCIDLLINGAMESNVRHTQI